jgi:hypothetical protein
MHPIRDSNNTASSSSSGTKEFCSAKYTSPTTLQTSVILSGSSTSVAGCTWEEHCLGEPSTTTPGRFWLMLMLHVKALHVKITMTEMEQKIVDLIILAFLYPDLIL